MQVTRQAVIVPREVWWRRTEVILGLLSAAVVLCAVVLHEDIPAWRTAGTHRAPNLWALTPFAGLLYWFSVNWTIRPLC